MNQNVRGRPAGRALAIMLVAAASSLALVGCDEALGSGAEAPDGGAIVAGDVAAIGADVGSSSPGDIAAPDVPSTLDVASVEDIGSPPDAPPVEDSVGPRDVATVEDVVPMEDVVAAADTPAAPDLVRPDDGEVLADVGGPLERPPLDRLVPDEISVAVFGCG